VLSRFSPQGLRIGPDTVVRLGGARAVDVGVRWGSDRWLTYWVDPGVQLRMVSSTGVVMGDAVDFAGTPRTHEADVVFAGSGIGVAFTNTRSGTGQLFFARLVCE
jgi:hypothetical protein